jgi:import inner membrane translocase subunit TIM50
LSYLNRDLSKVILLDAHPEHISSNPENSIVVPKWSGDPKDKGLIAMIPFLECLCTLTPLTQLDTDNNPAVAIYKPPDVRPILKAYEGKDIPIEYGKREAEMKSKHIEEWKGKHKHTASVPSFGSLFGLSSSVRCFECYLHHVQLTEYLALADDGWASPHIPRTKESGGAKAVS